MKRIQLTKNFYLDEYIPRWLYVKYDYNNKHHLLTHLIDNKLVEVDQRLRDKFGPITINNWWGLSDYGFMEASEKGEVRNWSGLRTPFTMDLKDIPKQNNIANYINPYYKPLGSHSYGLVSDKIFKNYSADEIIDYIRQNYKELGITELETGTSWVHSGIRRNADKDELYMYPVK